MQTDNQAVDRFKAQTIGIINAIDEIAERSHCLAEMVRNAELPANSVAKIAWSLARNLEEIESLQDQLARM